jgi:hypothetical protein
MSARARRLIPFVAPLCPVLLSVFPLLSLFAGNKTDLETSVLWIPLALCVAGALTAYGILLVLTKSAGKAAVLSSLAAIGFYYYGLVPGADRLWQLALWLGLCFAALVAVVRTRRHLDVLVAVFLAAGLATALPQVVSIALYQAHNRPPVATDPRLWPTTLQPPPKPQSGRLPDIYVLVPDDYERADALTEYWNYDNTPFLNQLKRRGFVVSGGALSPYSDSESNVAALVNMDYLTNFGKVLGSTSQDVRAVQRVIEDSRAARLLSTIGYDYVHLDTDEVTYAGGNPGISSLAAPDTFRTLWLQQSLLRPVGGRFGFDTQAADSRFRDSVQSVFAQLQAIRPGPRPKFVLFHTLLPHDPYVYDARGNHATFGGGEEQLASAAGRRHYLEQLKYTSTLLLDSVDAILTHATTPPVIVIQSDEGFSANEQPFGERAMLTMRVKGLAALYLPGTGKGKIPDPPNSVNDLRLVFNTYFGTSYPMLDSHASPEGDYPYQFEDMGVR